MGGPSSSNEPFYQVERCKRCGKEAELVDGLCTECKWEIDVGMKPPIAEQEKHHHWPLKKEEKIQES